MSGTANTAPRTLVGIDFGYRSVSVSFMLPKKNGQPSVISDWPGAEDATAVTVPFQVDRLGDDQDNIDSPPVWGYLAQSKNVISDFLLGEKTDPSESIRQRLSRRGEIESVVPPDISLRLRQFVVGFKRHLERSLQLSFGKEIPDSGYAVSCALPAWMANPTHGTVMKVISDSMTSNITCCPAPAACLTYYLSKAKKPGLMAGELFLHCSIDETCITLSHYGLRSEPGNTLALSGKTCRVLLCGSYYLRDVFHRDLEDLLLETCPEALPPDGGEIFRKISEVSEAFYKWVCTKYDGARDFKARLPWDILHSEHQGFLVRRGQLLVAAATIRDRLFAPLLAEMFSKIKEIAPLSRTRTHILVTGALGECPHVSQSLSAFIADEGRKNDWTMLPGMNGVTAAARGAAILIDGGRKHPTVKRRWVEWTPTIESAETLTSRSPSLKGRVVAVELAVGDVTGSETKSILSALRKKAGVLMAELMNRSKPTEQMFRIASCCQKLDHILGNSVGTESLAGSLETLVNEYQQDLDPAFRLKGLHHAALNGNAAAVRFFWQTGSDINQPSSPEALHPLHYAITGSHEGVFHQLLELGANLSAKTGTGRTCLHIAANKACEASNDADRTRTLEMLRLVLQHALTSVAGLSPEDDQGSTPLDIATELGKDEVVKILEAAGARGNTRRENMRARAIQAVETGDMDSLTAILADPSAATFLSRHVGSNNSSILHVAVGCGRTDATATILKHAVADINHRDEAGNTVLHMAIQRHDVTMIGLLLSWNASLSLADSEGMLPIHRAIIEARYDPNIPLLLIRNHASRRVRVDLVSTGGWTALHLAAELGMMEISSLLLRHGANIDAESYPAWGHVVVSENHNKFSRSKSSDGSGGKWRPLHIAASTGNEELVRLLLEKGAARSAKDGHGCTAAERAAANGFDAVVKLLILSNSPAPVTSTKPNSVPEQSHIHQEPSKPSKRERFKKALRLSKTIAPKDAPSLTIVKTPPVKPALAISAPDATETLHAAIRAGSETIVKLLLEHSLVNSKSSTTGHTPISSAVIHGRIDTIKLLLAAGADPSAANSDDTTALHLAAGHCDPLVFQELEGTSDGILQTLMGEDRRALIFYAVATGSVQTVRRLLLAGKTKRGEWMWPDGFAVQDALWHAIVLRRLEAARIMIQEHWPCRFHHLSEALATHDTEFVKLVCVAMGKSLYFYGSGRNAFHLCAERGNGAMFRLLLSLWAGPSDWAVTEASSTGHTPFVTAITAGNKEVAAVILESHPEEQWRDLKPPQPAPVIPVLNLVFWSGNREIIMMLVSHMNYTAYTAESLVTAMVKDGEMTEHAVPLLDAIIQNRPDITESGQLNNGYNEILNAAAACGNADVVHLIAPLLTSKDGRRQLGQALVAAAERDQEEVVKLIWDNHEDIRLTKYANIALFRTAEKGSVRAARSILASTVGSAVFSTDDLWSGLEAAAKSGHMATMRAFYDAADCPSDGGAEILHFAIRTDNDVLLKALFELGVNPKLPSSDGWPPLYAAVIAGSERVAEALLGRHSIGIDSLSSERGTPLHQAVISDNPKMVGLLLQKGAKTDIADEKGDYAIHLAARFKRGLIMEQLCSHSSFNLDMLHAKNKDGKAAMDLALDNPSNALRILLRREAELVNGVEPSTLHYRCRDGNVDRVKLLLEYGASVDVTDSATDKCTPLHDAVVKNHKEVVEALLGSERCNLEARADGGQTPLSTALNYQFIPLAELLRNAGARLDCEIDHQKWQPVHSSARAGRVESLKYLIEKGIDIRAKTSADLVPLHLAAVGGHLEVAELLLSKGCPVDEADNARRSALMWAAEFQHVDMVKLLLKSGANIHHTNDNLSTPLHIASREASAEVVRTLIDAGADIHRVEKIQDTALHWAAYFGRVETIRLLLANGANTAAKNNLSKAPIHYAAQIGSIAAAEVLLDAAPDDIEARMEHGRTPLHVAALYQQGEFIRFLAKRGANLACKDTLEGQNNALILACLGVPGATTNQSVAGLAALLDLGLDIKFRNLADHTPLVFAIKDAKSSEMVELCLSRGADPDARVKVDEGTYKPTIMYSVGTGQPPELIDILKRHGANFEAKFSTWNVLQYATEQGNAKAIEALVKIVPKMLNEPGELDLTPLIIAAENAHVDCIEKLVELGADVHARNRAGSFPLHSAVVNGKIECVRALAKKRASMETLEEAQGALTPLSRAIWGQKPWCREMMQVLIQCGAKVDAPSGTGWLPIHYAANKDNIEAFEVLHQHKADLRAVATNEHAVTALHTAATAGHSRTIKWLLSHGVPDNIACSAGYTALYFAIRDDMPAAWDALLAWPGWSKGVLRGREGFEGFTALHAASELGRTSAIHAILKRDRTLLEAKGPLGNTPLHQAAVGKQPESVKTLLEAGASTTARTNYGATPALTAAMHGDAAVLRAFPIQLIRGDEMAQPPCRARFSTLHMAVENGNLDTCKEIMSLAPALLRSSVNALTPQALAKQLGRQEFVEIMVAFDDPKKARR